MIKVEIIGNLGRDAFVTKNASGQFVSFSVAHSQKHTDQNGVSVESTIWVSCTLAKFSDSLLQYLKKGVRVFIRGNLSSRLYTDKAGQLQAGLNCAVKEIELCGGLMPQAAPQQQTAQTYSNADIYGGANPYTNQQANSNPNPNPVPRPSQPTNVVQQQLYSNQQLQQLNTRQSTQYVDEVPF